MKTDSRHHSTELYNKLSDVFSNLSVVFVLIAITCPEI